MVHVSGLEKDKWYYIGFVWNNIEVKKNAEITIYGPFGSEGEAHLWAKYRGPKCYFDETRICSGTEVLLKINALIGYYNAKASKIRFYKF